MAPSSRVRLAVVIAFGSISSVAFANAAMRLALEMFEFRTWKDCVVTMVVMEA
ncbi:MAG: hypothetical protein P4L46_04645 [Fimbriimonas sp.]|nr:hypothetical protein [Fimbriimonas sp.]